MDNEQTGISQTEKRLGEEILEFGEILIDAKDDVLAVMDEHRFVSVFLPMFAGDEVQHYKDHGANIGLWHQFAGSPFKEVRVVDKQGQELFRVPAIFDSAGIKPMDGTGESRGLPTIADTLARANMIAKQGPLAYDKYMTDQFAARSFMFQDQTQQANYIARWNAIFQRYNRPLIPTTGTPSGATNTTNNERPVDFDSQEFEPL